MPMIVKLMLIYIKNERMFCLHSDDHMSNTHMSGDNMSWFNKKSASNDMFNLDKILERWLDDWWSNERRGDHMSGDHKNSNMSAH